MIKKKLAEALARMVSSTLGLGDVGLEFDHPKVEDFGDFSTNIAIKASKELKQSPLSIANKLIDSFYKLYNPKESGLEKIEVGPAGFINFFLSQETLWQEVHEILSQAHGYGSAPLLSGKKIMIEFADPNPFKEFHIGHLRNIAIGEALVRLNRALGAEVWSVNYQGDVGLHVAKSLWGLKSLGFTKEGLEKSSLNLQEKVKTLGEAYVAGTKAYEASAASKKEILTINLALYNNQDSSATEILELWQVGRAWSLEHFEAIYQRLGTTYRRYYFESEVAGPGRDLVLKQSENGVFEKSQGAIIFNGENYGLHKRVFVTQEGYATYEAKDLYLAYLKRSEFDYDLSVILTGDEQAEYFKVVLTALAQLDKELARKTVNIPFGMVNLKGEKMASRKGNIVTAGWLLDQAKSEVKDLIKLSDIGQEEREEIAEKVAVAAVKYFMLKSDKIGPILFDLAQSVALEGNSGPYLQYTFARARSVLRKADKELGLRPEFTPRIHSEELKPRGIRNYAKGSPNSSFVISNSVSVEEKTLLRTLYKFPEVVETATLKYQPHLLCSYLFNLAQKFNLFYNNVPILSNQSNDLTAKQRLALTTASAQVIKNGLYLLGISAPERM